MSARSRHRPKTRAIRDRESKRGGEAARRPAKRHKEGPSASLPPFLTKPSSHPHSHPHARPCAPWSSPSDASPCSPIRGRHVLLPLIFLPPLTETIAPKPCTPTRLELAHSSQIICPSIHATALPLFTPRRVQPLRVAFPKSHRRAKHHRPPASVRCTGHFVNTTTIMFSSKSKRVDSRQQPVSAGQRASSKMMRDLGFTSRWCWPSWFL